MRCLSIQIVFLRSWETKLLNTLGTDKSEIFHFSSSELNETLKAILIFHLPFSLSTAVHISCSKGCYTMCHGTIIQKHCRFRVCRLSAHTLKTVKCTKHLTFSFCRRASILCEAKAIIIIAVAGTSTPKNSLKSFCHASLVIALAKCENEVNGYKFKCSEDVCCSPTLPPSNRV